MKKLSLIFILTVLITVSYSQTESKFYDNFDNNTNAWKEIDDDEAGAKIQSGFFIIHNKLTNSIYRFWRTFYFDDKQDFTVKARLKQIAGPENYGYGIMWCSGGWENSYNYEISSSGYYRIYYYVDKVKYDIKTWTASSNINVLGTYNILSVEKKDTKLNFYINDSLVYNCSYLNKLGNNVGFVLGQNIVSMVDYIDVSQKTQEIKVADKAIGGTTKENMGSSVNSTYSEIAPIISPDGKTLYVARARDPNNFGTDKTKYDIWYTELGEDGKTWSALKNIGIPLNNTGDNLVISVSADNNTLLLEGLYNAAGGYISDKGISRTTKKDDGTWAIPTEVVIKNYYNYNEYESFCPTSDMQTLVMSVQRADTYGDKDLYVSFLNEDKTYTEPLNMGKTLNTYASEGTPFIASDSKTLYFYSYGHAGYGSADIFVTKRLDDTWTNWSEPLNLGTLVNSSDWDTYFSISAKADFAYLVSTKGALGNEDVFKIKLKEDEVLPEAVVLIHGVVYDTETNKPLKANIIYKNTETEKELSATSDPVTGEYTIILPCGEKFEYMAEKAKYFPTSESIDLTTYTKYTEVEQDLFLAPLKVGENVVLKNILFKAGTDEFIEDSYSELTRLVQFMKDNATVTIEIQGHTENRGDKTLLLELSQKRAQAVKDYLVENGIDATRITNVVGFGSSVPIGDNETEAGRKKNRRVEFKIKTL